MPDPQLPPTSEASAFRAPSPQPPQAKDQSPAKPAADMSRKPHGIPPTQHTSLAVPDSLRTTEARPRTAFFPNITWKRPADTSQTAGSRPHDNPPTQARKLLDLFAGKSAPISAAASLQSIPRWEPIDIAVNAQHDILQDAFFHRLLQLAWSGSIGLLVAAPPCRDYSILKLAPGGPPPCRSPEHMDGLPSNSPKLQHRALESKTIHLRCHELCRAVAASGGIWVLENPPTSMAWLEPSCQQLLQSASTHVVHVDACTHGCMWSKAWAPTARTYSPYSPHAGTPSSTRQSEARGTKQAISLARKQPSIQHLWHKPFWAALASAPTRRAGRGNTGLPAAPDAHGIERLESPDLRRSWPTQFRRLLNAQSQSQPAEASVVGAPEVVSGWGQIQAHHCTPRTGETRTPHLRDRARGPHGRSSLGPAHAPLRGMPDRRGTALPPLVACPSGTAHGRHRPTPSLNPPGGSAHGHLRAHSQQPSVALRGWGASTRLGA